MASTFAFAPSGPTSLVGTTAVQIGLNQPVSNSYLVQNISAARAYFTHGPNSTVTSVGAPSAGVPSINTIGMSAGQSKVFTGLLPWMIASAAGAFEVTPGDGV